MEKKIKVMDLRGREGNFFPSIKKMAEGLERGEGFEIIQSFEPFPLYDAMKSLGYTYQTEKTAEGVYHVVFMREEELLGEEDKTPFKPIALLNYPLIDETLGEVAVKFWDTTWRSKDRTLSYEMRLLLSLSNAVGAGRMRQAGRELIKAYACGVSSAELADVFELLAWNQGIGFFSSEIGPSSLFKAFKTIKNLEKQGKSREAIVEILMEKYGEKNPEISVK